MNLKQEMSNMAEAAKLASRLLLSLEPGLANAALKEMRKSLIRSKSYIMKANANDLKKAKKTKIKASFTDRLRLTDKRIEDMGRSIGEIIKLDDSVGAVEKLVKRPNGLLIGRMRVPIGVILVIYESRPNVTADCMALALKSANSLILRGGSEAINSNIAIFDALEKPAVKAGVPKGFFNMVKTTDRKAVDLMLGMEGAIDVVIPRGGESLIRGVARKSRIPVIKHYKGVCHVYVDDYADINMAESISFNAKVQRPGVCNAMETLLVHRDVAARFLPSMAKKFIEAGVEVRGCSSTKKILKNLRIKAARESDWHTEYLDLIVSVKVVGSLSEAIDHINKYGTSHSDAIITEDNGRAMRFLRDVDSGSVYINASTRFTDGYEFGKGAEMGISTDKLHARGPVGIEELTTYKYVIFGNGQIRR